MSPCEEELAEHSIAFGIVRVERQCTSKLCLASRPVPIKAIENRTEHRVPLSELVIERDRLACGGLSLWHELPRRHRAGERELEVVHGHSCVGRSEIRLLLDRPSAERNAIPVAFVVL